MCWGLPVSIAMTCGGAAATGLTARRPLAIPVTIAYFTFMEALQAVGYLVVDQCGSPLNQMVALLSYLHIVFQPFFINAFAMQLVPAPVRDRARVAVYTACALSSAVMLVQLYPFDWAGLCRPGSTLCGPVLCTVSGEWHIGWDIPFNGLTAPLDKLLGFQLTFPTYALAAFIVPLFYGAWRFVLFHAVVGPLLASLLTDDPNEMPAIWCLFSIAIVLVSLSPWLWGKLERKAPATA